MPLLIELRKISARLCFASVTMRDALKKVARGAHAWKFDEADIDQFACQVSCRIRCMCRHAMQAAGKKSPPAWVLPLTSSWASSVPLADGESDAEKNGIAAAAAARDDALDRWTCGYDAELKQAWRIDLQEGAAHQQEFTNDLLAADDDEEFAAARTQWPDGMIAELASLTVGQLRLMRGGAAAVDRTRLRRKTPPVDASSSAAPPPPPPPTPSRGRQATTIIWQGQAPDGSCDPEP